ncbi:aldo/keto reductase [Schaalia hyovaginalis]|uniref:2,5-diketo-D-gluconate reductase A n=1 Tax=Schaalia hyovaginalis TaxID=29316 RepID=A0A923J090_9ACTO|nr:aldo/keto reductase [Schaalia hyovaginalis]MBB6335599.1 2,5-diketo-D-gluconate reductase A [Schaalia hyovaginalis]MDY2669126.1 aldo/keto reductase [Schaalia hyovaginalis]
MTRFLKKLSITLPTGAPIPVFGFGTYKVTSGVYETVSSALALGYRHIDTAQMYGNEAEVGRAIADSGVPREELFITSKLDNGNHEPAAARASFDKTLADLRTDYVDLFLIHWPLPTLYDGDVALPWPVLEEFHAQGRARAIGLSNYTIEHIERVLDAAEVAPHVLQVEAHPFFPNNEVRDFARAHGMTTQAWSPLARGRAAKDPALARIAASIGRTGPQVALRWALDRGDIVFPKSVTPARQAENLDVFSFTLADSLRARIDALDEGEAGRTGSHPDTMNRL